MTAWPLVPAFRTAAVSAGPRRLLARAGYLLGGPDVRALFASVAISGAAYRLDVVSIRRRAVTGRLLRHVARDPGDVPGSRCIDRPRCGISFTEFIGWAARARSRPGAERQGMAGLRRTTNPSSPVPTANGTLMREHVLVAGGTGVAGRAVVRELVHRGHPVSVMSRRQPSRTTEGVRHIRADLSDGSGLEDALRGVHTLVDVTDAKTPLRHRAVLVDGSARLIEQAVNAGVKHAVLLSVVGVEFSTFGYYKAKVAQELNYAAGDVPFSIVRTTQFHDFMDGLLKTMSLPGVTFYPSKSSFQPIATSDVALLVADAVGQGPSGRLPARGGPQVLTAEDLARRWRLRRRGGSRVRGVRVPGDFGRFLRDGQNVVPDAPSGTVIFDDWLTS